MIHKTTRSILSVLLAALLLVTSTPLTPAFAGGGGVSLQSESSEGSFAGGTGTANDPYQIATAEELRDFAKLVNEDGETTANAILTDDIDLSEICSEEEGDSWTPIGNSEENAYSGTFNGQNFKISGLTINNSRADDQGLFGCLDQGGTVKDLTVSGSVKGDDYVGGVVGQNRGSVENCYNTGAVNSSGNRVGGVVGDNRGTVKNCHNIGAVSGVSTVGGVVGYNISSVTNCYNTGAVNSSGNYVGGVVGDNGGTVKNCYNTGAVNSSGNYVGGVVGYNYIGGSVTNSYNTGAVNSSGNRVGGVVGWNDGGRVENCYNTGAVSGNSSVGGVVGLNSSSSTVTGCYFLQQNPEIPGIGNGGGEEIGATAEPVDNLDELCEKFKDDTDTWTTSPFCEHPVLQANPEGGLGTATHPYEIKTIDQLKTFRDLVNGPSGQVKDSDAHAKLMNDIDLEGNEKNQWTPIGNSIDNSYEGTFNGDGNTISGLYIVATANNQGLFGCLDQGGTVKDLSVSGSVTGVTGVTGTDDYVGGVVGRNFGGTVENCYNTGTVSGSGGHVDGVVGYNSGGSVTNCYFLSSTADVNENLSGIGEGSGTASDVEPKTAKDFHSGEVAWRLQNGQVDGSSQVWGQNLMNEPKDNYPQLRAFDADTPQVYKVAFMNDSEEHDAKYANSGMTVTIPAAPSREGHTFTGWSDGTSTYQAGAKVEITSDTKFTAQWTKDTVNYTVTVTASPAEGGTVNGGGTFAEGTQVTVTATANDGYTFVAWQEGGTKIENAGASYTFTVNDNCTLTAIFEKEPDPTPTPTPTPDPTPSGPSTGDSTGWDDIRDELENAENGDEITIDMGDETKVPAEIFESLAGKDVEISFDLGDIQWSVNGADIPTDTDFTDLDLGVNLDTSGIPVNVINTITGEVGTVQITLAHDGEFGFTMTLTAPLGKENAGYWANLYHYDESAEAMNFEAAAKIDEDGSVTIPFSHASQYAIVIDTHSHATVDVSDLFIDIAPDAWYKDAIQYAYDNGLMTGVSDTEFAPEATTTRAMIVSILARLEGVTTAQAAGFADVDDNDWYATAVNWAANVGVVNGYEDNTFRPNTAITREQLAAILMNYAAYKGEDVSNRASLATYTDQPSTWAEETMSWAVAEGLINGVTNDQLQPQGKATRAQVAAILQRYLEA